MIYRILGELEIGPGGRLIDLPGGPTLTILATLLANPNRRISKTELIRVAWGSDEVEEAQLYKRIKVVRDLLTDIGRGADLKTHARFGYELRVPEDDIDVLLFQRLMRNADAALAERRTVDEIDCLRRALRLWRGAHPLSNVPSDALRQETLALEQRYKRAAVRLFDLELARDNHERILDELILVSSFYPSDQRLCEQLMTAEYRCGHMAEVARSYERYRETFSAETGGDPDPLLRNVHFAIARGDETGIAAAWSAIASRTGSPRPVITVPRQLPPPTDLVGRAEAEAEVARLLRRPPGAAAPVVVISGPGGIGKTALALRAAHASRDRYPDGQLFAELHGTIGAAPDTSELMAQFLRAFGVSRIPDTKAERLSAYRTLLADRRVLIVLDDAADGLQVSELIPANSGCAVLVTARRRLPETNGAHHIAALGPLPHDEAVELFRRVVRDAGLTLPDETDAIGRVVGLCGGLPLALRIAGALRVRDHSRPIAELAERLDKQGPAGFVYGELSLVRTTGAGLELLDADARRLFLGLGLLRLTGFGSWTAAALLDSDGAAGRAALSQLAARFMVETADAQTRYHFHDLTREYARRRAEAEYPEAERAVAERAYRALLTLTRRAHARLHGGDFEVVHSAVPDWDAPAEVLAEVDAAPMEWLEQERPNIRLAVEHCAELGLADICWDLAVSAHEFYAIHGYVDDWYVTHSIALAACRTAGNKLGEGIITACLNQPTLVASRRVEPNAAVSALQRAADLVAECGHRHAQAIVLRTLANALRRQAHITEPLALFADACVRYAVCGDIVGHWQALRYIGQLHLERGDHAEARRALEHAGRFADELGDSRLIAQTRYWSGQASLAADDLSAATAAFGAVLDVYGDSNGVGLGYALHGVGQVAVREGAYGLAAGYLAKAASLASDGADAVLEGRVWLSAAALSRAQGRGDEELAGLERANALFAECGARDLEVRALAGIAELQDRRGDGAAADAARARLTSVYDAAQVPAGDRLYQRPTRTPLAGDWVLGPVAQQRRVEDLRRTALVQGRRAPRLRGAHGPDRLDEPPRVRHLPGEITRVERHAPDDFVHVTQVADGELGAAERGRQGGELEPGPGPLDGVVENPRVVEGELVPDLGHRSPAGAARV
jgi:DNA-binding SARP family transcriptional activator